MNNKINIKAEDVLFTIVFVLCIIGMVVCGACILGTIWVATRGYGMNWWYLISSVGMFCVLSKVYSDLMGE